jgi:rare lipoprotein A (peptidoglycan hydrolase)
MLSPPRTDTPIIITRINIEEKVIAEDIDFKIVTNTDSKLSWREKKITQEGVKGIREVKYRITYKNGKETARVVLEKNITKNPMTQIVTQGTYMQLGHAAKGQGTWYVYQGGLFAASTAIPKGNYVKVTNTANGKSVVVQINDYGPQGKGRIIDLDKVAFAKIASIGAGVIGVKVEEVLN